MSDIELERIQFDVLSKVTRNGSISVKQNDSIESSLKYTENELQLKLVFLGVPNVLTWKVKYAKTKL